MENDFNRCNESTFIGYASYVFDRQGSKCLLIFHDISDETMKSCNQRLHSEIITIRNNIYIYIYYFE